MTRYALLALMLAGCGANPTGIPCGSTMNCPTGLLCVAQVCVPPGSIRQEARTTDADVAWDGATVRDARRAEASIDGASIDGGMKIDANVDSTLPTDARSTDEIAPADALVATPDAKTPPPDAGIAPDAPILPKLRPMPTARAWEAAVTENSGEILVIGGMDVSGAATAAVEAYNPLTNLWSTKSPMPTARGYLAASGLGVVGAAGGIDATGKVLSTVEVYTISTDTWATSTPMTLARYGFGLDGDGIAGFIAFGGWTPTGTVTDRTETYAPSSHTWSARAAMLQPLAEFAAPNTGWNGKLAGTSPSFPYSTDTEVYNGAANTWVGGTSTTYGGTGFAAAYLSGYIYFLGGGYKASAARYQPSTDTWTTIAPMPAAMTAGAAAADDGKIYWFGGMDTGSTTTPCLATGDVFVYDISTGVWE